MKLSYLDTANTFLKDGVPDFELTPNNRKKVSPHQATAILFIIDCGLLLLFGALPVYGVVTSTDGMLRSPEAGAVFFALGVFLTCQKALGGYRSRRVLAGSQLMWRLVASLSVTFAMLALLAAATRVSESYSPWWFFSWMSASFLFLPLVRWFLLARLRRKIACGACIRRTLWLSYMAEGEVSDVMPLGIGVPGGAGIVRIARPEDIEAVERQVRDRGVEDVYVSVPWHAAPDALKSVQRLQNMAANVYIVPWLQGPESGLLGARGDGSRFQIQIASRPITGWAYAEKRSSDIILACVGIAVLLPVMVAAAIAVKLDSRGPVLFRQRRLGVNSSDFQLLKFRSMYDSASDPDAERQTTRGDGRVTRVGRFLRRTSIDELPQLFNVLKGEMSIVGPRPHALKTKAEGQELDLAVNGYAARHRVKPGMTGWAQVNGLRGELDSIEKLRRRVEHDMAYIESWSLGLDFRIILRTLLLVFRDSAAY